MADRDDPREAGGRGPAGVALREGRPQLASVDAPDDADWHAGARAYGLDSVIVAASGTAAGAGWRWPRIRVAAAPRSPTSCSTGRSAWPTSWRASWDDQAQLERSLRLSRFRDAHRTIQRALLAHPEPAAVYMTLANALVKDAAASAVIVYAPEGDLLRRVVGAGPLVGLLASLPEPPRHADEPPLPLVTQAWMEGEPVVRLQPAAWPDLSPTQGGESLGEVAAIGCWPIFLAVPGDTEIEHHAAAVLLLAAAEIDAFDADLRRLLDEISDTVGLALRQYAQRQTLFREQERQTYLALHDALTDLPNRRALDYHLERALARAARHHHLVAVGMLDLDDLKPINDRYGHAAGDRVLVEVARRLHDALRSEDSVARVGGDEFVLVLEDLASEDDLAMLLERLWQSLQQPIALGEESIDITVSLGVALYPTHAQDSGEQLLRLADQAMYHVKARKHQRANWWALARGDGDAGAMPGEAAGLAEPYGAQAAAVLRPCVEAWQAQLPMVAERFHAAIAAHAGIAGVLASFPAPALAAFKERLARHLQTLCYPELDEAGQRAGAIRAGLCQAACGLEEAWLAEAVEQLRVILGGTLGRGPRTPRHALAIVLQRLGRDQQWQLESMRDLQRRREAALAKIHAAAWSAHDTLDLLEDTVQVLAAHEELIVAAAGRPDAAGEMVSELVAGAVPAEVLRITNHGMAPPLQVDRVAAQEEEPLRRAWRSGRVERSAHYGSDPAMALWRDTAERHGIVSQVAVPLCLAPGRPVALLALYGAYPGGFRSAPQRAFIEQLGQVLELALLRMAPRRRLATLLPAFVAGAGAACWPPAPCACITSRWSGWPTTRSPASRRWRACAMTPVACNCRPVSCRRWVRRTDAAVPRRHHPGGGAAAIAGAQRPGAGHVGQRAGGCSARFPLRAHGGDDPAGQRLSARFAAFRGFRKHQRHRLLGAAGGNRRAIAEIHRPQALDDDRALGRNLVARLRRSPFDRIVDRDHRPGPAGPAGAPCACCAS
ncbi:Diguanylate cyclase OS=Rhodanobacter lindaniclasticus OX=75310 GN=B1991_13185 PE=4 SV=1 [Rhodanobacter lindaniclasticus]